MNIQDWSTADLDEPLVRHDEIGESDRYIFDFGPTATAISADVVGETVIIVGPNDEQLEFDIGETDARTFIKNGVLTIEVNE